MKKQILVTRSSMPPYEEYVETIRELWDSHWITNMGKYHNELEKKLKKYLNIQNISLMVNGHMALEMAIKAMGLSEGAEVITTPFTFISTTHAIVRNGLTPVFCDIKTTDYTIDENRIENLITDKTKAIIPVHVYGNVCAVEKIQSIADKYNLRVIYDASHCFGVTYKEEGIGTFGDMSTFSFHATKVFNTIEGGAVTFNNSKWTDVLYNLKNFGIRSEEVVAEVGANAKMNEFAAVMGICNLKYIDKEIEKRKKVSYRYTELLEGIDGITLPIEQKFVKKNYGYYPILIDENIYGKTRDDLYDILKSHGIYSRKYFYPLTCEQVCFGSRYRNFTLDNAKYISRRILVLPLYADLSLEYVNYIADIIKE